MMEGISSLHSWIKANTMIRPTKMGKSKCQEGQEGSDEEDETIIINLSSQDPNWPQTKLKWDFDNKCFNNVELTESMIDHLEIDSKIVFAESREGVEQIVRCGLDALWDETEDETKLRIDLISRCKKTIEREKQKAKEEAKKKVESGETIEETEDEDLGKINKNNQFAFIERFCQTKVLDLHDTVTQTDSPPVATFSASVSPAVLYDFFSNDTEETEEKEKTDVLVKDDNDDVEKKMALSAKIVERLINLNTFDDIARDYRFFEDPSDDFQGPKGSLLPLWQFAFEPASGLEVTSLQWSNKYKDLFAVSYGSFDFYNQPSLGFLCLFSLKNPSYPEYLRQTACGVMSLDLHPVHTHMVAVALYDGNVAVFNLRSLDAEPSYMSTALTGKHKDVTWQVCWGPDNLDGYLNFYSVSGDGLVNNWTLVKTALWCTEKLRLDFDRPLLQCPEMEGWMQEGVRSIAFKPDQPQLFLVGTEEGRILLATTEYSSTHLRSYTAHTTPINCLAWNTFQPSIFISCASEFVVHIWHQDFSSPIMMFDLGCQVGQVSWAPYSSTVFAAVTEEGRAFLFDLDINKYNPICSQKIITSKDGVLNSIEFAKVSPLVIVGDSTGRVHSLKLSPNLRKIPQTKTAEEAVKNGDTRALHREEVLKLTKMLEQVIPATESHSNGDIPSKL